MKIWTVTEAVFLTGDFCGDLTDGISAWSKSFLKEDDARLELEEAIRRTIEEVYDGIGDRDPDHDDEVFDEIVKTKSVLNLGGGRRDIEEYAYEFCNRVCRWKLFEQEVK